MAKKDINIYLPNTIYDADESTKLTFLQQMTDIKKAINETEEHAKKLVGIEHITITEV